MLLFSISYLKVNNLFTNFMYINFISVFVGDNSTKENTDKRRNRAYDDKPSDCLNLENCK